MNDLIRVAMISQRYYPHVSGIATQLAAIAPVLQTQGLEVYILTRHTPGLASFEKIAGVSVYRLSAPGPRITASLTFILNVLICLRRLQPDVIHAHELFLPTTAAIAAKYLFDIPVVATAHMGGPLLGEVKRLKRAFLGMRRLTVLRQQVDIFVVISPIIDAEMAAVDIPAARRVSIPNGIDMMCFAPLPHESKQALRKDLNLPSGPIVIFTGRLASEKRVHHLLALWPTVRERYSEALLLIVGSGPEEWVLQQTAADGVWFVGAVDDVAPYLQAADLFVLPSVAEGFSISTLEAMATGLPVIATPVGAIPDFITHGDNGWIIPPDDTTALQEAMLTLLGDPTRRVDLGHRARERVVRDYSLSRVASRLQAIYSQLASKAEHERG